MTSQRGKRPVTFWVLVGLLLLQGLGGLAGGIALSAAPDGSIMHMPTSLLRGSPFPDYLVPGLVLLLVLGVLPLLAVVLLLVRPFAGWLAAFTVGCGLVIWLVVEVTIIPFSWLQVSYGLLAVLIVVTALLRPVRTYCGAPL
jgi:hypothetical protein